MTTKRSNAEIADELERLFVDYGQANFDYGGYTERFERNREAANCREIKAAFLAKLAALREPTTFSDAAVEAGFKAQCEELPEFGNENRENMMRVARATIEAAIAVYTAERNGPPESKT